MAFWLLLSGERFDHDLFSVPVWLCFLLPGYALARRWNLSLLQSGLPGAVAMSAFASLAAVCVFIVPAHVLGLPTLALSAGLVAFVLWGVVDLTRSRQWSGLARLVIAAAGAELVVLGIDLLTSARVGTVLGADAVVHVARVRHLLGQGLTNGDPFLGGHFYPIYHTNLLHSLLASLSQITGEDPLKVWFSSLPFAKVLIFCGAWFPAGLSFEIRFQDGPPPCLCWVPEAPSPSCCIRTSLPRGF